MDKRLALLLLGLFAGTAALAQAYRWVDAEGVVHYSDRPEPGAEIIQLPEANVTSVRRFNRPNRSNASENDEPETFYTSLDVTSPAAEETLWNIEGVLTVALQASPALRPADTVRVYFDGQPVTVESLNFELGEVWRGAHNLQAEIVDPGGNLLIRSQPIRFYVQQTSLNN